MLLTGTIANLFLMTLGSGETESPKHILQHVMLKDLQVARTKLFLSYQYWNEEMHHAGEFIAARHREIGKAAFDLA